MPKETYSMIIKETTDGFIQKLKAKLPPPPYSQIDREQAVKELLEDIAVAIYGYNALQPRGDMHSVPKELPLYAIAELVQVFDNFRLINFGYGNKDEDVPAVYMENGPDVGLFSTSEIDVKRCLRIYNPGMTERECGEVISLLKGMAPHDNRCENKDFIPVNNGIFDRETKSLMPFSPEYVFTSKSRVNYAAGSANPSIIEPDGSVWDVESWMTSLSDDPEIVNLLWQVTAAVIRPGESWNKAILFYNKSGNNGKGTLCSLMRNLCGEGSHVSLQLNELSDRFGLAGLIRATAVITDENDVDDYLDKSGVFKALVTHDVVKMERKYKDPISLQFTGLIVQCVNSIPRFKDKGGALYRRLLPIPFEKCFTGVEKRYIKDDYLKRPEVLEYVLWKVLNMDFNEFSEPAACLALLNEYKEYNNPIRQFAEEILPQCAWDLLPFTFLYDLYKSWFERNCPSGRTVDHKVFINELADVLRDYPEWICDRSKEYRRKKLMDSPEPLISAYCLDGWYNKGYHGSDAAKIFTPTLRDKYRGLIRASVVASADNDNDSDDNDDNDQCEDMDKVFTAYTSTPKDLSLAG